MTRRLVPGRRSDRPAFGSAAPQPATFPFPKGRFLLLALALVMVISMLLLAEQRMDAARRQAELVEQQKSAPPLLEDRTALLNGLFQGSIRDGVDNTEFGETPSFDRLIYHVRAMPKEEFSKQVTRWLDWKAAMENPQLWRGEFVRVRGLVGKLDPVKLHHGADDTDIYRGFIGQPDGTDMVAFDFVDKPPNVDLKRDVLDIEGVFYRTLTYESVSGEKRTIPYLIARDVKIYESPADPLTRFEGWKFGAVIAASVAIALVAVRFGGRRRRRKQAAPAAAAPTFHKTP
jgi:hypothetical protein